MDLLKEHIKCLDNIQDSNICPNIENLQAAQSYVNYCLNTRLTNISNYNTINFEMQAIHYNQLHVQQADLQ